MFMDRTLVNCYNFSRPDHCLEEELFNDVLVDRRPRCVSGQAVII